MATSLLTTDQLSELDRSGYVSLGQLLSENKLKEIRSRVDELVAEEGEMGGHELFDSKHIQHPRRKELTELPT